MSLSEGVDSGAAFLLMTAVQAGIVLCSAWAVTLALRKRSAALRHEVWLAGILVCLLVPAASPLVPAWHSKALAFAVARLGATGASVQDRAVTASYVVNAVSGGRVVARWVEILFGVWGLGTILLLIRLAAGFARMARGGPQARRLDDVGWTQEVGRISESLGIARPVQLFQSADRRAMPLTWGLWQPKILIPASAIDWPSDRRRVVLLHELSHIARRDCASQIISEFLRAIHWFNPLAWLAVARLRQESECACDDSVLNSGVQAPRYAHHLLVLAHNLRQSREGRLPALAMARPAHLERRFASMLNPKIDRRASSTRLKLLTSLAALCLLLPVAALRLAAQNQSGKFTGTIYDPSGAAIPNATIIMIDHAADTRDMTTSDAAGKFQFTGLPPGEYEFEAVKTGFKVYAVPTVTLDPGRDSTLDANLDVGSLDESIAVTGRGPASGTAATGSVVNEKPKRIRVGGDVEQAHIFTQVLPAYPESAKTAGVEGTVVLHAVIAKDGSLLSLRVMNGQIDPALARSAVEAVSHWRYRPTLLNGDPIEVDTTIQVTFSLTKG
ncbi:MAG TPA: M56 family metallopeptidase [Candidatus Cybelea sp.]|nr:M56 family metallopeptidase [Candidatus Cybelea sp.]